MQIDASVIGEMSAMAAVSAEKLEAAAANLDGLGYLPSVKNAAETMREVAESLRPFVLEGVDSDG